jgi:dephospho-CoA kinase
VVDVDPVVAIERLVAQRGLDEADARSRVSRQAPRSARRAIADWIIDNSGSRLDLAREVRRCWTWLERLPQV